VAEITPIPVVRAAYVGLFMDLASRCAADRAAGLERVGLPPIALDQPDAYVPLRVALQLIGCAAPTGDIEDVLVRMGARLCVTDFAAGVAARVRAASTLESALHGFSAVADREHSAARFRLVREGDVARVRCTLEGVRGSEAQLAGEWLRILPLLTVVRRFAGSDWAPAEIGLRTRREVGRTIREAFPHTRLRCGEAETTVAFPAALLDSARAGRRALTAERLARVAGDGPSPGGPAGWDFPTSLREILKTYMGEGYPDLALAARIVGCSVRTLQRRLEQCGASYSQVVQEARFEAASALLTQGDTTVLDTAHSVGYSDPSHFARAFRRYAGVSPTQYRMLDRAAA